MARLIDADALKEKYREMFVKSLVDKERGIDLSEYAEEPSKSFNRFIDEIPTVDVLDKIMEEIQENINYNKKMNYQGIVAGLLLTLDIIDKYKAEEKIK